MADFIRRVVTGHDKNGKAIIISDGPAPSVRTNPNRPGHKSTDIWKTTAMPVPIACEEPDPTLGPRDFVPAMGTKIRIAEIAPEPEAFRHLKSRLKLEQFGGETPLAIQQEFHATILLHNLATLAAMDALSQREEVEIGAFGVNLTHASHLIRLHLPRLLASPEQRTVLCQLLLERIAKKITRRRIGRPGTLRKPDREKPHPHRAYK